MSVLVSKRSESKVEAITYSEELYRTLMELIDRNFGIKDLDQFVRVQYAYGKIEKEDFSWYRYVLRREKERVEKFASLLTTNLRSAYARYPTNLHEYEIRRDFQNDALVNCSQLLRELQRVVDIFHVDLNVYERCVKAIEHEIDLIKRWRQRDNQFKSRIKG